MHRIGNTRIDFFLSPIR